MAAGLTRTEFGTLRNGEVVEAIELFDSDGLTVRLIAYGAAIQSLFVPDREGQLADVVLGRSTIAGYEEKSRYFGATVGRYANRIAAGRFSLDGVDYRIAPNNGPNALHGGAGGFDRRLWTIAAAIETPAPSVTFHRVSEDGEEGFPGRVEVDVTYTLSAPNELTVAYEATTDRVTIINMTNHSFFNLGGVEQVRSILDHRLSVEADAFLPVDATSIPTGEVRAVADTAFDFRTVRPVGACIRDGDEEQIVFGHGYDHNFVLRGGATAEPKPAARLEDPASGRVMELLTTEPGVQVYAGNFLDSTVVGKYGEIYRQSDAFCLEPQHFPDSPNRPEFPSVRLDPGEVYRHVSIYRFSTSQR
ncbi:aldose epimerase family protein [Consotaella aegiceratis]|uniref:aldose epimerase family protein n=1 Tax=Consotaella aegiceratis TaxID=3097961 RepID=UPI002F424A33